MTQETGLPPVEEKKYPSSRYRSAMAREVTTAPSG